MTALLPEAPPAPKPKRWQDEAACAGFWAETYYDAWFGPNEDEDDYWGGKIPAEYADRARAICAGCPVRAECLAYAEENGEVDGIWGGFTPYQRTLRKSKREGRAA
jgi:WhiB family transcriptional regulator, redox-sensing transcriptional regulator